MKYVVFFEHSGNDNQLAVSALSGNGLLYSEHHFLVMKLAPTFFWPVRLDIRASRCSKLTFLAGAGF